MSQMENIESGDALKTKNLISKFVNVCARRLRSFLIICLVASLSSLALAADPATPETRTSGGPRRQLATILFAGLGGAVLGLSTLSFYGRPQDKLANIAIGFAGGVIIGTTYVTYRAATNPTEFYGTRPMIEDEIERNRSRQDAETAPRKAPTFAMTFEF